MVQQSKSYTPVYWFPMRTLNSMKDWDTAEGWQPALNVGARTISLDVFFETQEACEFFIRGQVFMAAGQLGFPRVKIRGMSEEDMWD